jgi:acetyl-CoA synthetase
VLKDSAATADIHGALKAHVAKAIGPIAKPRDVVVVPDVPKTRSGKIMRRLLTQLFEGTTLGDTTSLQNEPAVAGIQDVLRERAAAVPAAAIPTQK